MEEDIIKIFDSHTHYYDEQYKGDLIDTLINAKNHGVYFIVIIAAEIENCKMAKDLCYEINSNFGKEENEGKFPKAFFTTGLHPDEIPKSSPNSLDGKKVLDEIMEYTKDEKCVAIGEVGLDYYGDAKTEKDKENQKEWFIKFIQIANEKNMPLVIHSRDAANDTITILEQYRKENEHTIVHCYSYDKEMAKRYLKLKYSFGIGGVITFKNAKKLKEAVEIMPLEKIILETDCPYLSPEPLRGKRNESKNLEYVLTALSEIKQCSKKELADTLFLNTKNVYNLIL